jgi:predicted porin
MTLSNAGAFSASFSTRNLNSINYDTPKFGGFSASVQFTAQNAGRNSNVQPTPEGREIGLGGQFVQGPLAVVAGFSQRNDGAAFQGSKQLSSTTTAAYLKGAKDTAWLIGAAYTMGSVKMGLSYADTKYDSNNTPGALELSRKGWNLGVDWTVAGPHMVRFGYADAGDTKCSGTAACPATAGANTGAKQYQVGYHNVMSKRTTASVSYVRMNNDTNGIYTLTGSNVGSTGVGGQTTVQPGSDSNAIVLGVVHTF